MWAGPTVLPWLHDAGILIPPLSTTLLHRASAGASGTVDQQTLDLTLQPAPNTRLVTQRNAGKHFITQFGTNCQGTYEYT